jgi:hypothetical protein
MAIEIEKRTYAVDDPKTSHGVPTLVPNEPAYKPPASPQPQRAEVEIDDSNPTVDYANFCRLLGTPEELLIDFGLNSQAVHISPHSVVISQRIVTGWYTAKRLLHVLQQTVKRHEATFGAIELDAGKRAGRM